MQTTRFRPGAPVDDVPTPLVVNADALAGDALLAEASGGAPA